MFIGDLDRKIVIYTHTTAKDGAGQPIKTREIFATVYAGIEYKASSESVQADTLTTKKQAEFTIYHLNGITEQMEIYIDSEFFEIISIHPFGKKEGMIIKAQKMER